MDQFLEELAAFPNREQNLRGITRYSLYPVMRYRTNLWIHSRRTAWIAEELSPTARSVLGEAFDPDRACALALVHDDAEMVMGDFQAGNKEKMGAEEIERIQALERDAIDTLVKRFPVQLGAYEYRSLLLDALEKRSTEAMVVDWADKLDAFGEALHEIFAGHQLWTTNVVNEYGTISLPTDHYLDYFSGFTGKFPSGGSLLQCDHSLWQIPERLDVRQIAATGRPHTPELLRQRKGYLPYDEWVAITLSRGEPEDVADLHTVKE